MTVTCNNCRRSFEAKISTAKYCGQTCKQRAWRRRSRLSAVPAVPDQTAAQGDDVELVDAVTKALAAAGRLDSASGRHAVWVVTQLAAASNDTASSRAALSRELSRVMAEALADFQRPMDAVDELRARAQLKKRLAMSDGDTTNHENS